MRNVDYRGLSPSISSLGHLRMLEPTGTHLSRTRIQPMCAYSLAVSGSRRKIVQTFRAARRSRSATEHTTLHNWELASLWTRDSYSSETSLAPHRDSSERRCDATNPLDSARRNIDHRLSWRDLVLANVPADRSLEIDWQIASRALSPFPVVSFPCLTRRKWNSSPSQS